MVTRKVHVKADGSGDYLTLAAAGAAMLSATASGDVAEIVLHDATAEAYTFINYAQGSTWIIRSNNPMGAGFTGGTKILPQSGGTHGLRFLGATGSGSGFGVDITITDVRFNIADFTSYYDASTFIAASVPHQVNFARCAWQGYNANVRGMVIQGNNPVAHDVTLDSCVFWAQRSTAVSLVSLTNASATNTLTLRGVTFYDASVSVARDANMDVEITALGCIFDPYAGSEINLSGSGGALVRSSSYGIFTRASGDVSGAWDSTTNGTYSVSLVTGTPSAGQVGFTDITTGDFSLVADANNLAIDYVVSGTMPSTDIEGTARPVGTYADAGAFEAASLSPPTVTTSRSRRGLSLGLGLGLGGRRGGGSASASTLLWSAASTWDSGVPGIGDNVTIAAGRTVYLDTDTAALGTLTIEGTLIAKPGVDSSITAEMISIEDGGALRIGSEAAAFTNTCTITLTGTTPTSGQYTVDAEDGSKLYNGMRKALMVRDGGTLDLHGVAPTVVRTRINAHVSAGASSLTLSEPVTWAAGDKIALSKTDFYSVGDSELLTVASDVTNSTTVPLVETVTTARWGLMMYVHDDGTVSTTQQSPVPTLPDPLQTNTLDSRATVLHLTRNIVIQGADDSSWSTDKFGGHTMAMGLGSTYRLENVEFKRMGQQHFKGRYPIHWHMLSFEQYVSSPTNPLSGDFLGDVVATDHYAKKCAIWDSSQRAVVIHGTCGVTVEDCNAYDIEAHAFFEEDGAEERNTITRCAAMKVRDPGSGKRIKLHDARASGFWLTNPNNVITHNYASDCAGQGLWNAFSETAFGLCRDVAVEPIKIVIDEFNDNIAHSNSGAGIMTQDFVLDEAGNTDTGGLRYLTGAPVQSFTAERQETWKNSAHGYQNRIWVGNYTRWKAWDNDAPSWMGAASGFFGSSAIANGVVSQNSGALIVRQSANNATAFPQSTVQQAVASYHFEMDFPNMTAVGYQPQTAYVTSNGQATPKGGALGTYDLYYRPSWGLGRSANWALWDSVAFVPPLSPQYDGFPVGGWGTGSAYERQWTLNPLHDPYGYVATAGHWIVPDIDVFTYGRTTYAISGVTTHVSVDELVYTTKVSVDSTEVVNISWSVLDGSYSVVDTATTGAVASSLALSNMREFVAMKGGYYKVDLPDTDVTLVDDVRLSTFMCYSTDEWFLVGVPWDGSNTPTVRMYETNWTSTVLRTVAVTGSSIADVLADTTGATAYLDTASDMLWVRFQGTISGSVDSAGPFTSTNNDAYQHQLRIQRS